MTNQEAIKVINETLDAAAQKGLYGNLVTAAGVHDAFRQLTSSYQAYEKKSADDAITIINLQNQVKALDTALKAKSQLPKA